MPHTEEHRLEQLLEKFNRLTGPKVEPRPPAATTPARLAQLLDKFNRQTTPKVEAAPEEGGGGILGRIGKAALLGADIPGIGRPGSRLLQGLGIVQRQVGDPVTSTALALPQPPSPLGLAGVPGFRAEVEGFRPELIPGIGEDFRAALAAEPLGTRIATEAAVDPLNLIPGVGPTKLLRALGRRLGTKAVKQATRPGLRQAAQQVGQVRPPIAPEILPKLPPGVRAQLALPPAPLRTQTGAIPLSGQVPSQSIPLSGRISRPIGPGPLEFPAEIAAQRAAPPPSTVGAVPPRTRVAEKRLDQQISKLLVERRKIVEAETKALEEFQKVAKLTPGGQEVPADKLRLFLSMLGRRKLETADEILSLRRTKRGLPPLPPAAPRIPLSVANRPRSAVVSGIPPSTPEDAALRPAISRPRLGEKTPSSFPQLPIRSPSEEEGRRLALRTKAQPPTQQLPSSTIEEAALRAPIGRAQLDATPPPAFNSIPGRTPSEKVTRLLELLPRRVEEFAPHPQGGLASAQPQGQFTELLREASNTPRPEGLAPSEWLRKIGTGRKELAQEIINLPRAGLTIIDQSAWLRQGGPLVASHPLASSRAMKDSMRAFFSETVRQEIDATMRSHRLFPTAQKAGLAATDLGGLATREEVLFGTRLLGNIPGLGIGVRASERGFTTMANSQRMNIFVDVLEGWEKAQQMGGVPGAFRRVIGADPTSPAAQKSLATYLNAMSGRGSLGRLEAQAPLLTAIFFAPRFAVSHAQVVGQLLSPRTNNAVRTLIAKDLASFIGVTSAVLGSLAAAGANIETDCRSSDFGKVKIGNTRLDFFGGFGQLVRLICRIQSGEIKNLKDAKIVDKDASDTFKQYLFFKLAPPAQAAKNVLFPLVQGKRPVDFLGRDIEGGAGPITDELLSSFIPLFFQDVKEAVEGEGLRGLGYAAPAFFGVGVQTFETGP